MQLASFAKNNLRFPVVFPNVTVDFDLLSRKLADIANVPQVIAENYYRERACAVVFAEIQVGGAARTFAYR